MPVIDGLEAARLIRKDYSPSPNDPYIIAITGNAYEDDRRQCFSVGMQEVLVKPVEMCSLASALERAKQAIVQATMDQRQQQQQEQSQSDQELQPQS